MFELFISALLHVLAVTGQPASANATGSSNNGSTTQANAIGNSGWGGGDATPPTTAPAPGIGNSGWGGGD